jgi:hypothetical protein
MNKLYSYITTIIIILGVILYSNSNSKYYLINSKKAIAINEDPKSASKKTVCNFADFNGFDENQKSVANLTCTKMKAKNYNNNQIAYMIATFDWESSLQPKNEYGCTDYVTYSKRKCGRGLIQFTQTDDVWRQYQNELNNNMFNNPNQLLDANISIDVAILYMEKRDFKSLVPGIDVGNEFIRARGLVNGVEGWRKKLSIEARWQNAPNPAAGIDRWAQKILKYLNK